MCTTAASNGGMRTRLFRWLELLRASFWFVPSVMLFASTGLALLLLRIDARIDPGTEAAMQWAYSGGPEGARSLLSTVAGSMITAASVTFSLASVALSLSSQQFGSRVLRNFMRDRVTQVMLGAFVATFLYSVLVVRAIRGSDYGGGFVPAISITFGIFLTLVSLLCLVYFIHHVSTSIQASHIIKVIAGNLDEEIDRLYPTTAGKPDVSADTVEIKSASDDECLPVQLNADGYLDTVDLERLLELASRHDCLVELLVKPGDFVLGDDAVARIQANGPLDDETNNDFCGAFALSSERTPTQDIRYGYQQLTDVIVRALSPGINDPFTAVNGIDELTGKLLRMVKRPKPAVGRKDADGHLRLVTPPPGNGELLDQTVGHIGVYAASDRFVMARLRLLLDKLEPHLVTHDEMVAVARLRTELRKREAAEAPDASLS